MNAVVPYNQVLEGEVLGPDSGEGDIIVAIRTNPFMLSECIYVRRSSKMSMDQIVRSILDVAPPGFEEFGEIDIDGLWVPRQVWRNVRAKPRPDGSPVVIGAKIVPHGGKEMNTKNIMMIVGAVALLAATAWIGGGGLAAAGLGEAFAAGTFGAQAAAATVGLVGVVALQQLSPAPVPPDAGGAAGQSDNPTGISTNALKPFDYMTVVLGKMFVSPPRLTSAYSTLTDGVVSIHAVVGLAGEYHLATMTDNLRINDVPAAEFEGLQYQIRPGSLTDTPLTIANKTVFEQRSNVQQSVFILGTDSQTLKHNDLGLDAPKWQNFTTRGVCKAAVFRILVPGGISQIDGDRAGFPVRIQFRRKGTSTWLEAPEFHFRETQKYGTQHRAEIRFDWDMSTGTAFSGNPNLTQSFQASWDKNEFPWFSYYRRGYETSTAKTFAHPYFCGDWRLASSWQSITGEAGRRLGPVMTSAAFPQSGWTITASSNQSTVWRIHDWNTGTGWSSSGGGTHTITIQMDQLYRVSTLWFSEVDASTRPYDYTWYTSIDGVTWLDVGTWPSSYSFGVGPNTRDFIFPDKIRYVRYVRLVVRATGNGTVGGSLQIRELYVSDAGPIAMDFATGIYAYQPYAPANVYVDSDGFTVKMDPNIFPLDVYEFRIKKGTMYLTQNGNTFLPDTYQYQTVNDNQVLFFEPFTGNGTSGNPYRVRINQSTFRGDSFIEVFQSWKDEYPLAIDDVKVALIGVVASGVEIDSIATMFHSIMPIFNGTHWNTSAPTNNGAAEFRYVLTGTENARPMSLDAIDDDMLEYAYNFCATNGIEVNLLVEGGEPVEDLIQTIASAMFGFVARSSKWGLIIDEDRTGEIISQNFSPINTNSLSMEIDYTDVAHALYVEYTDEDKNYKQEFIIVYLDGYSELNAVNYDSVKYRGPTNETAARARALYDLRAAYYRNIRYRLNIGVENLMTSRGRLVGLTHDIVSQRHAFTTIVAPVVSGPNITGLILEDISLSYSVFNDFFAPANIFALADIFDIEVSLGAAITKTDGTVIIKPISLVDEPNSTIMFVTPFADDGKIEEDFQVGIGPINEEHLRCIVVGVERAKDFEATIQLVDEAPEIHAPPP